jgi:hypothetical protein
MRWSSPVSIGKRKVVHDTTTLSCGFAVADLCTASQLWYQIVLNCVRIVLSMHCNDVDLFIKRR